MPNTLSLQRVFRCPPSRLYRAFLDPAALAKWNAPDGFTATVHSLDARVGGRFRISFTNFSTGRSHAFGGEYLALEPDALIRSTDVFEDANLPGTMVLTVRLVPVSIGTRLEITQEGLPDVVPLEACELGWQESLALLAHLVEPEIPDGP